MQENIFPVRMIKRQSQVVRRRENWRLGLEAVATMVTVILMTMSKRPAFPLLVRL